MLAILLGFVGMASGSRRRVAVLDFEGNNAAKIQADIIKLIKRSHTVITQAKWDAAAESLSVGGSKLSNKDIKKVARKLKLDGVITGVVEKRRSNYIIRVKLHAGTTGALVGDQINTQTSGLRLDSTAQTDLRDELLAPIGELAQNRGGSAADEDDDDAAEDEDAKPVKKVKPTRSRDTDTKPAKQRPATSDDDDDDDAAEATKPVKRSGFSSHRERASDRPTKSNADDDADADADEDDNPLPVAKKRPAKTSKQAAETETASNDDDADADADADDADDSSTKIRKRKHAAAEPMDSDQALSPQERAVDLVVGLSVMARRLHFVYAPNIATVPPGYNGVPVPGFVIDGAFYPGAFGHKRGGIAENLGATVLFDKVLKVSTKDAAGTSYATSASRFAIGVIARYPLTKGVVGASLRYGKQSFDIAAGAPVPGTSYTYLNPELFLRYPVNPKILVNASFGVLGVSNTGDIQKNTQYGGAKVIGIDVDVGADYMLKKNVFARAAIKVQTYGYTFKGTGMLSDPNGDKMADVTGARDSYYGFAANIGYLY